MQFDKPLAFPFEKQSLWSRLMPCRVTVAMPIAEGENIAAFKMDGYFYAKNLVDTALQSSVESGDGWSKYTDVYSCPAGHVTGHKNEGVYCDQCKATVELVPALPNPMRLYGFRVSRPDQTTNNNDKVRNKALARIKKHFVEMGIDVQRVTMINRSNLGECMFSLKHIKVAPKKLYIKSTNKTK